MVSLALSLGWLGFMTFDGALQHLDHLQRATRGVHLGHRIQHPLLARVHAGLALLRLAPGRKSRDVSGSNVSNTQ